MIVFGLPMWFGWLTTASDLWMWIWIGVATLIEILLSYYGITPRVVKFKSRRVTFLLNGLIFYLIVNTAIDFVSAVMILGHADV